MDLAQRETLALEIVGLQPLLQRQCQSMLRYYPDPQSLAEDLSQEAVMKGLRFLETYDGRSTLSTWMFSIAKNAVRDYIRQNGRRRQISCHLESHEDGQEIRIQRGFRSHFMEEDRLVLMIDLRRLKSSLDSESLQMLVLVERGYDYRQISYKLGLSIGAVKSRLYRLRSKL